MAEGVLHGTGVSPLDAARLVAEMLELLDDAPLPPQASGNPIARCHRLIPHGAESYRSEHEPDSYPTAVEESLLSRAERRSRTLGEIRQYSRRLLRVLPDWTERPMRHISASDCRRAITTAFDTPATRRKARSILHGIFAYAERHGWCRGNPLRAVDLNAVKERPIEVLTITQIRRLLATAQQDEHLCCAPALGLMLWAGIRPAELERLCWQDIHFGERVISINARHSKTGGARHVTLYPVLARWLLKTSRYRLPSTPIVPRAWTRRWRDLRQEAGFKNWTPDVLRHTFASYHLKHYRDYAALQIDMGHADVQLLRTRYLSMKGVTAEGAAEFWGKKSARIESTTQTNKP